jgi:tripartite-type tricarboxylate transporter receptor subunit TctC
MWRFVAALVAAQLAFGTGASAEEWPARTITMINPFAAGGPNDVLARLFAQRWASRSSLKMSAAPAA